MNEQTILEIENLVAGELSAAESASLRGQIQGDSEFQSAYETELYLKEGVRRAARAELKDFLGGIEASLPAIQNDEEQTELASGSWKPLLAAASVVILVALYFTMNNVFGPSSADLYESYYEPYSTYAPVVKRGGEEITVKYDQGMAAYEAGDYASAIAIFEGLPPASERDFFLAQSQMANGNAEAALPILEGLENQQAAPRSSVQWYLALAYLKADQVENAEPILRDLVESDSGYAKRANEILRKL